MPELPEVETIKEALKKTIEGAVIHSVTVFNRRFRIFIPNDFEEKLIGRKILRIYRIAKYVVLELDNHYSILWHFGMSGRVKFISNQDYNPEKHDHVIFKVGEYTLVFNDARRFGLLTYSPTEQLDKTPFLSRIGIDPFDKKLCAEYLFAKLQNKHLPIKVVLLDQTIICGIGNIYASEALYLARISPLRDGSSLSLNDCKILIIAIQETLQKAIKAGGSTLKDYRKPDGSMGYFQYLHSVYGKDGQNCPDCCCNACLTGGIKKIIQAGRSTFYCPCIQK